MMQKTIYISLPVTNLAASVAFYKALGFVYNPMCSDDTAVGVDWSENIKVMLITHEKWRTFTTRPIPPSTSSEVGFALTCDNRETVDAMNNAATAHGGVADINPAQDLGFMYCRDMADPDGHIWGAMWFDPAAMQAEDTTT